MSYPFLLGVFIISHISHFVNIKISFFSFSANCIFLKGRNCMFWENYVSLCADKGVSPNAVAAELHLSSGSVTAWKGGAVPRETTLRKIASYFDVSVDSLIGFSAKNPPAPEGAEDVDAELFEIWRKCDAYERQLLLDMARSMERQRKNHDRKAD